jgi:hypothetical protein
MPNVPNVLAALMQFLNFIKQCPQLKCRCLKILTSERLCGDGFMDFIHRPKSKILKILQH